jgi:serine/threonine protein kinase
MKDILKMASDIGSGLKFFEKNNYVHKDIKLQNLFLSKEETFKIG